jgi:hypothetical protein
LKRFGTGVFEEDVRGQERPDNWKKLEIFWTRERTITCPHSLKCLCDVQTEFGIPWWTANWQDIVRIETLRS